MVLVLLNWIFLGSTLFGLGFFCMRLVRRWTSYWICDLGSILAMGIVLATVYAQVWSLFGGVGILADGVLWVFCVAVLCASRKELAEWIKTKKKASPMWSGVVLITVCLWAYCTSRGYMHYDSDLYHAQSIRWIEEYGIVKGLGNIHVRFAYNSSFFALSALYSMPWLFGQSMHCVNGFMALLLCLETLKIGKAWKQKRLMLSDYARIAALYYLTLIYGEITAPASDYASMCTIFYLVIKWLSQIEENNFEKSVQDLDKDADITPYALLCVGGVFAVSLKLTAGLILLLVLKPAYRLLQKKQWKEIVCYLFVGSAVIAPWLIRNVLLSGYLLYPFPALDLFDVDWKIPAATAALDAAEIKTWGRGLNDASLVALPIWQWFPTWFRTILSTSQKLLILADLLCLVIGGISILHKRNKERIDVVLVWITIAVSFLFWLFSAPLLRYGYAYVLLLLTITAGSVLEYVAKWWCFTGKVICILLVVAGSVKLLSLGKYIIGSSTQAYYSRQKDYGRYEMNQFTVEGIFFYYPQSGDRVGYDVFPAVPRKIEITLRGEGLKEGFRY